MGGSSDITLSSSWVYADQRFPVSRRNDSDDDLRLKRGQLGHRSLSKLGISDKDHRDAYGDAEEHFVETDDITLIDYPDILSREMIMTKISHKTRKRVKIKTNTSKFRFYYREISKIKVHEFSIDDIRHITDRELARHYREELGLSQECERRWVSLTYFDYNKQKLKSLHLVADTSHDLKKLLSAILIFKALKERILKSYLIDLKDLNEVKRSIMSEKYIPSDKTKKEFLFFEDILKYCKRLDINLSSKRLLAFFETSKAKGQTGLDFKGFKRFVELLRHRQDLATLWNYVTSGLGVMNFEQFQDFVVNAQHENLLPEALDRIFRRFCSNNASWTLNDFNIFLNSKLLSINLECFEDKGYYSHPLNDYFILSSHNTYLIGRQIAGELSVAGYVRTLQRGCRCVEIDIWNNNTDETAEPIVNHGRTFSSHIKLSDVLLTIKRYAFQSSSLPIILSLEIHCSAAAQNLAVIILKRIFGSALVLSPISSSNVLPSPEDLRNKVVIKVKKTKFQQNAVDDNVRFTTTSTTGNSFSESAESVVVRAVSSKSVAKLRRKEGNLIAEDLSNLGVYCQGLTFRNFSLPESKTFNHCFSMSEKAINSMLKDTGKAESVDKHNRRFLMRVYPSKFRLSSSNFNPINYWAHGVQMVATNWQTYDLGQQLNEAFFDTVAGNGFVLKPLNLRRPTLKSTMRKHAKKNPRKMAFNFTIISAQYLIRPLNIEVLNPYITVEIFGSSSVNCDEQSLLYSTKTVSGNGFNPVWNESFSGSFFYIFELVFVKFTVQASASTSEQGNTKEIGVAVFNIFDMKNGYRYLKLKDLCGEHLLQSTLFVKVDLCK